ncbi:helix-turn-helix domain-containing protein [Vibrio sinensis]|uniref:Helix-turn-helix domain-containing protein n=1 Tax=Vibrio sinensis TaxID=2302434 RepID=A0A3A6QLN8_9VIBR|nr:S24 family peptidase [Vibrio sinensis]RJX68698.1 helix-turn-helix domain-containing protein [Vibrio sinensis]
MNTNLEELGVWIGLARRNKSLLQKHVADALGVTTQAVSSWENGKSLVSPKYASELAEMLDLDINIILDPNKLPRGRSYDVPIVGTAELLMFNPKREKYDDFYLRDERIDVPSSVCRKAGEGSFLLAYVVKGYLMEPVLKDGSIVLVDANQSFNVVDGAMYVVRHYDSIKIRSLFSNGPKKILRCFNPEITDELVDSTDKNFTILARVLWSCSEH